MRLSLRIKTLTLNVRQLYYFKHQFPRNSRTLFSTEQPVPLALRHRLGTLPDASSRPSADLLPSTVRFGARAPYTVSAVAGGQHHHANSVTALLLPKVASQIGARAG